MGYLEVSGFDPVEATKAQFEVSRNGRGEENFLSTVGDRYLLGDGRSDHDRLRVISEIHDGRTRELLRRAGLVSGHRFVEFGCGLGYVTRWAASEGANATGIDLNKDHLTVASELAHETGLKNA